MTETLTALGLQLIDEQLKTLNTLIDMAHKDKQKEVKYIAASRENSATKMYNLMNAVIGGRIINENNFIANRSQPKLHSGSIEKISNKLDKTWQHELMGVIC